MLTQAIIAGFILGVTGSLHCIGMCGPLSLAIPTQHLSKPARFFALFIYQIGRILTYSFLGALIGLAGRGFWRSGYQQWFSIVLGILILILASLYFLFRRNIKVPFLNKWYRFVQKMIMRILQKRSNPLAFLFLGMANGLLPCGMVYVASAAALTYGQIITSMSFMSAFGAGTLPAMLLIGLGGRLISLPARTMIKKAIPVFIAATGVLLILRGMNLGIPFISPTEIFNNAAPTICPP